MSASDDARAEAISALIQRAAKAAAMPIALHRHGDEHEHLVAAGSAPRQVCRWLQEHPEGAAACASSRLDPARKALRRGKPVPFVCHMGFACVSVPVPADQGVSLVATAGPFIPAEAPHSAHADATDGLERLRLLDGEPHPCTLDDIAVTPVSAAHACAEWLADDLAALYAREVVLCETAVPKEEGTAGGPLRARKPSAATRIGAEAAMCAAAVAGDWVGLRKTLGVALQVDAHSPLTRLQRARALRVAATVLEAAESTNTPGAATCRSRLTALGEELSVAESGRALLSAVLAFLKPLKGCSKGGNKDQMLTVLHAAVSRDVAQSVSLEDIARELGVHPTAVTHRLQRTLGLSYTEYVGQLRVEKAKELLRRTQLGVGEVGRRVGIDDPSNFAKLFRRHEGISPGDYRKNRGKRL